MTDPVILPTQLPPTHLAPRPIHPTPRIFPTPRNQIKVYSRLPDDDDDDDENLPITLPPTTTALAIKKQVK